MTETKATVNLEDIRDQIRMTYLKSLVHQGWWAVRVHTDGSIGESYEASACYSPDEYYRREPHTVTVWESGSSTGYFSQEEADNENENGDWGSWFDCNIPDLEAKLEPTGLEIIA
jgi:hypothetical protein